MAQLIYFTEGPRPDNAVLRDLGLAHVIRPNTDYPQFKHPATGPDGKPGTLFAANRGGAVPDYDSGSQTWQKCKRYWVGYVTDDKPGPDDLRREIRINGVDVELGDGNLWHVPVARLAPQSLVVNAEGEWVGEPDAKYGGLVKLAERIWELFVSRDDAKVTAKDGAPLAAEALAWNYHIGAAEVGLLRLLGTGNFVPILEAVIDIDAISAALDAQKKTDEPDPPSPSGSAGS